MKNEQKTKKGLFGMLRESFTKTSGCCCGPAETCGGATEEGKRAQTKETARTKATTKPGQP